MYVSNLHNYGHLVNPDNYDTTLIRPDYYQLADNRLVRAEQKNSPRKKNRKNAIENLSLTPCSPVFPFVLFFQDWEYRYIHPDFDSMLDLDTTLEQVS